eukprot:3931733-Rhodomonas_salina.2
MAASELEALAAPPPAHRPGNGLYAQAPGVRGPTVTHKHFVPAAEPPATQVPPRSHGIAHRRSHWPAWQTLSSQVQKF